MASRKKIEPPCPIKGILGFGVDQKKEDGDRRVTQSENFLLLGGSEETHERMQDTAMRFDERLREKGKRLEDSSPQEVADLLRESIR